ncbi:hypothetical protein G6514_009835, partial [Epicoccum nigrum]
MARRRPDAAEYTVGWICALPIELAAAQVMLDEEHSPHDGVNSTQYTLGRIGSHNVVLACLPAGQMGIGAAAFSAGQATSIFTSIRFGLMVGVGGGAPSTEADVRLGDVVISQPVREHSGVVQYDFGKAGKDGRITRTGSMNAPPKTLLHAVNQLRAHRYRDGHDTGSLTTHLSAFSQHPHFSREKAGPDVLFEASHHHNGEATCERCSEDKMMHRTARAANEEVTIHYGTIASGNQVIKDAPTRERLSKELGGVLCFEMEAAGLMNDFPCLVVRGICDYADSHKNKAWQPYAAATAAACAKSILSLVPAVEIFNTTAVGEHPKYRIPFSLKGVPAVGKFAERPKDTQALEQALLQEGDIKKRRLLVLHGLGGMGKTQLAANFARRHQNRFSSVLWIDGSGKSRLKQSLAAFASRIPAGQISDINRPYATNQGGDIDTMVQHVLSWLSLSNNRNWLLVIDNVDRDDRLRDEDEEAYNVEAYLPEADHGSVLITTRLQHLSQLAERLEAKKVDQEQARAIFKTLYTKEVGQEADELLELLDGLPLALAQAAAYMTGTGMSFSTYTRLYKEEWSKIMDSRHDKHKPLRSYDRNVATTWTISYTAIRQENEAAANLLLLWAHLDNKGLWYELLTTASQKAEVAAEVTVAWLGELVHSEADFVEAIRSLRSYSLIEEAEDQTFYSMHPVVHKWAWSMQDDSQRTELSWLAFVLVGLAVPSQDEKNIWETQTRLLPHAEQCETCVMAEDLTNRGVDWEANGEEESTSTLLQAVLRLGDLYLDRGKINKAENMYMLVLGNEKDLSKQSNVYGLKAAYGLGSVYRKQNKLSEAKELLFEVLELQNRVYGENSRETFSTIRSIGILYNKQGMLDKAEGMIIQALNGYRRTLGEDHSDTLGLLHDLSWVLCNQGKYEKAEEILLQVLEGAERILADDNPSIPRIIGNLGRLYFAQEKFGQAEEMFIQALEGYEKISGPKNILAHHSALGIMRRLGEVYDKMNRLHEARECYLKVLPGYERLYGENHKRCQVIRRSLAILDRRERYSDSDSVYETSDSDRSSKDEDTNGLGEHSEASVEATPAQERS